MSGCFDACLCVLCLLFLLLLTILFYRKSASFFGLFVLVARGRIINPFNEIRIRQKTGKKESCAAGLRMKTNGKETHGGKRASSNTRSDSTLDARYMSKNPQKLHVNICQLRHWTSSDSGYPKATEQDQFRMTRCSHNARSPGLISFSRA